MDHKRAYSLLVTFISAILLLAACSSNKLSVKSDYRGVAFDTLQSYRWYDKAQPEDDKKIGELVRDTVKDAVDRELASKGLSKQPDGDVDFYVNFTITAETRVNIKEYNVYSGISEGFNWRRDTGFESAMRSEEKTDFVYYREGSLVIDIIDPDSDKLIWRGVASKRLTGDLDREQRHKLINQAVAAVLANFPPASE